MTPADVSQKRILVIDPSDARRDVLSRRLRAQGYIVEDTGDGATGAHMALSAPPAAVVADLWMPGISGVQFCRLLGAEPATAEVPVLLCGDTDEPRSRFWAGRAGAAAYVIKGRTGELMRALAKAVGSASSDAFFVQLSGGSIDIRDRLARHLDTALFESVIAAELRALANAGSFERLFDLLAQLMSQLVRYRWIALATRDRFGVHHHPSMRGVAESEARAALGVEASLQALLVEDEDAASLGTVLPPAICSVPFANLPVARFALGPCEESQGAEMLLPIVTRELGGAVKIASLIEESQRLAATDSLTGLMNRRAFLSALASEISRCSRYGYPLAFLLFDIDHFKQVNDRHGHAAGDRVLASIGKLLRDHWQKSDITGRWGGEEFVIALTSTDRVGSSGAAERPRVALTALVVHDDGGAPIPVSGSIGLAIWRSGESTEALIERADKAMYAAKAAGRNRVSVAAGDPPGPVGALVPAPVALSSVA